MGIGYPLSHSGVCCERDTQSGGNRRRHHARLMSGGQTPGSHWGRKSNRCHRQRHRRRCDEPYDLSLHLRHAEPGRGRDLRQRQRGAELDETAPRQYQSGSPDGLQPDICVGVWREEPFSNDRGSTVEPLGVFEVFPCSSGGSPSGGLSAS